MHRINELNEPREEESARVDRHFGGEWVLLPPLKESGHCRSDKFYQSHQDRRKKKKGPFQFILKEREHLLNEDFYYFYVKFLQSHPPIT